MNRLNKAQIYKIYRVICKHPRFISISIVKNHIQMVVGGTDHWGSYRELITPDEEGELIYFNKYVRRRIRDFYSGYGFGYGH